MSEIMAVPKLLAQQARVTGALVMNDVRARHGGGVSGMMWLMVEPIIILLVVLFLHVLYTGGTQAVGVPLIYVFLTGYVPHFIFRHGGQVGKAAIRSGYPTMFYHRQVDAIHLVLAKLVTESAFAIVGAIAMFWISYVLGVVVIPQYVGWIFVGAILDLWFIYVISLIFAVLGTYSIIFGRMFSPFSLMMIVPFLAFFMLEWLPAPFRPWLLLFPPANAAEMMRFGYIGGGYPTYFDLLYTVEVNLILTLVAVACFSFLRRSRHIP